MTPALGYYLWPARWIGGPPANALVVPPFACVASGGLADVICEASLPDELRGRAHRDGMLAYDFGPFDDDTTPLKQFAEYARRVQIINAHLACLKALASLVADAYIAPATGETVVGIEYDDAGDYAFSGGVKVAAGEVGTMIMSLSLARVEGPVIPVDWRFMRTGRVITEDEVRRSFDLLRRLLQLDPSRRSDALLYAELLTRAQAALSVEDNGGALIYAWTAAEGMLRSRFARWVDACAGDRDAGRDSQGNKRTFLDSKRKRELLEGRDITTWHMAEIGSLVGWLPFSLYRTVRKCAKARNDWLHKQSAEALEHAPAAISGAQELFELTEGIDLLPAYTQANG